jgi:hypothetical protein
MRLIQIIYTVIINDLYPFTLFSQGIRSDHTNQHFRALDYGYSYFEKAFL